MNYLIKLIGRIVARQIERGSRGGAIIGVLLGVIIGVGSAFLLLRGGFFGPEFAVAGYLILAIPLAISGALVGSSVGPGKASVSSEQASEGTR